MGLYIGFAVGLAVRAVGWRRSRQFPSGLGLAVCAALVLAPLVDVATAATGLRETTDAVRFWTGLGAGTGIAVVLYSALRLVAQGSGNSRVPTTGVWEWLGPMAASCLVGWAVISASGKVGGWVASGLATAGLVSLWTSLNAVLGIVIFSMEGSIASAKSIVAVGLASASAAALELFLSSQMHSWVLSRVGR
jgi:uncharacterized membrane protein